MKGKKFYVVIVVLILTLAFSFSAFSLYYVYDYHYWNIVWENSVWYKSPFADVTGRFDFKTVYDDDYGYFIYQDMYTSVDSVADYTSEELIGIVTNNIGSSSVQITLPNGTVANTYQYYDIPLNILDTSGQDIDMFFTLMAPDVNRVKCEDDVYVYFPTGYTFLSNTYIDVQVYDSNGNGTFLEYGTDFYTTDLYDMYFDYFDSPDSDHSAVDLNISLEDVTDVAYIRITLFSSSSITYNNGYGSTTVTSRINPWQKLFLRNDSVQVSPTPADPEVLAGLEEINKRFDELYEMPETHKQVIEAQKTEFDKIGDDLDNIGNALDSVTEPDRQEIMDKVNNIVGDSFDDTVVSGVFSPIFGFNLVIVMITWVFLFAMISYVLFGRKG